MPSDSTSSHVSDPLPTWVLTYGDRSLAVYREIAAHIAAVPNVTVTLQWNSRTKFRYEDSQIAALSIQGLRSTTRRQVESILDHYGSWQKKEPDIS